MRVRPLNKYILVKEIVKKIKRDILLMDGIEEKEQGRFTVMEVNNENARKLEKGDVVMVENHTTAKEVGKGLYLIHEENTMAVLEEELNG